jgi:hypothetical protein
VSTVDGGESAGSRAAGGGEERPGRVTPDPSALRGRRAKVPHGWRRRLYDYIFVPAEIPERFQEQTVEDLAMAIETDDLDVAKAVLAEAQASYAEPFERAESAERRATTLQGGVAIAAAVATAGLGFVVDPTKIHGHVWRVLFAVTLLAFVGCLIASAIRALSVTGRIFELEEPGVERIVERAQMTSCDALTHRAAELLHASAVADEVGAVKVGLLRSAVWWFRRSLIVLALVAALGAAYVIAAPAEAEEQAPQPNPAGEE